MSPAASPFDVKAALVAAAHEELNEHGVTRISLRAVARRAGVSHAAPKHHFGDRAGLLTAVAADGFRALAHALARVSATAPRERLADLGEAYLDFGGDHPALFELMFQPAVLHPDDDDLVLAQREAIGALVAAVAPTASTGDVPELALVSWALVHGLSVLTRDGALDAAAAGHASPRLAHDLIRLYAGRIHVPD